MSNYAMTDTDRRLANVFTIGTVASVDPSSGVATVKLGDATTDSIPWMTQRAGGDRTWWAPEVGEQVVVAAVSGDLSQGIILGSLYQDAHAEPADSLDVHRTVYNDGTTVEYDRAAHKYTIDVSASAGSVVVICKTAEIQAAESVTVDSPQSHFTGMVTIDGLLTWKGGQKGSGGADGVTSEISGPVNFKDGPLTHEGVTIDSTHVHHENGEGSDTGTPH
ncbi:phage baseplate assembly protein V [Tardiphaga sp. 20_F10_N6_6]|uniref:phage baseplate assembly protein V n=1 Tax=Tardiphaga sp. 20_F10_N6_6 TaxID=3240788 RepID=UPI003F8CCFC6